MAERRRRRRRIVRPQEAVGVRTNRDPQTGAPRKELAETEVQGEAASLASLWKCPQCGAQIQIIVGPQGPIKQPFTCVDGTAMVPGEEH
jgi:hypothetical protein